MTPQIEVPRVTEPARDADVMREQLDYLIEHATGAGQCGCAECQRFRRVRAILLEIFEKPPRAAKVQEIVPQLARAA